MSAIAQHAILMASTSGFLDSLAVTPVAVYSLRKLISGSTVSIRVRRAGDGSEMDIGFNGSALDVAALSGFAGSGDATVVKFYDQTGLNSALEQTASSKQPLIVSAGTVLPNAVFDRVDDSMKITALTLGTPYLGIYMRLQMNTSGVYSQMIAEAGTNYNTTLNSFALYGTNAGATYAAAMNNGAANTQRDATMSYVSQTSLRQSTVLFNRTVTGAGEIIGRLQGSAVSATSGSTYEQTGSFANNDVYVGGRAGTSVFAALYLESLVFYNADSSGVVSLIENRVK